MKRLIQSLIAGVIIAAGMVGYEAKFRYAALAHSSALNHETAHASLVDGFVGVTFIVTVAFFLVSSVAAGRQARTRRAAPQRSTAAPQRRRRVGAGR